MVTLLSLVLIISIWGRITVTTSQIQAQQTGLQEFLNLEISFCLSKTLAELSNSLLFIFYFFIIFIPFSRFFRPKLRFYSIF